MEEVLEIVRSAFMSRLRAGLVTIAVLGALFLARNAIAQMLVRFHAPHAVRTPSAVLDPVFAKDLDSRASAVEIVDADGLVAFALRLTARELHFGLSHRTRLSFDGFEREGNCIEYSELLASIINREHGTVDARAWVVRSDAKILGTAIKDPAWKDHDWVLVVVRTAAGTKRLYVDPTLYDMGLGWDISHAVHGEVRGSKAW